MFIFVVPSDGVSYTSLSVYYKNDKNFSNFYVIFEFGSCFFKTNMPVLKCYMNLIGVHM